MTNSNNKQREMVLRNYRVFQQEQEKLVQDGHLGRWVVISPGGKISDILDTERDARLVGGKEFGEGNYSLQLIKGKRDSLGFLSSAKRISA